ncbi:clumping factor A-like [Homarus americanus]|uniref:clumping factor A-like n=1 Tax=Homarus americanus TaxID=6706 RepID=UPI001C47B2E3|nr:clumping factor A-like [Homarus americanus]
MTQTSNMRFALVLLGLLALVTVNSALYLDVSDSSDSSFEMDDELDFDILKSRMKRQVDAGTMVTDSTITTFDDSSEESDEGGEDNSNESSGEGGEDRSSEDSNNDSNSGSNESK